MQFLLLLVSVPAFCAVTNLRATGATSTQIIVSFTRPDATGACTIEVSKTADFATLEIDVDPNQFTGADLCSRAGNVLAGRQVTAVLGKRGDNLALSAFGTNLAGWPVSRALRADREYYIRVTASGDTATITARTGNIPLGDTRGEALAVSEPFEYKRVTSNPIAMPEFNDPYTGALIKQHAPLLGWVYAGSTVDSGLMATGGADCNQTLVGPPAVKGSCKFTDATGAAWGFTSGSLTTAIRAADGNYVTYSGTAQEELFIRLGPGHLVNNTSIAIEWLSWQNFIFVGKVSDAAGDGGQFEYRIALDYENGVYASPWRTLTFTTSDSIVRGCHDAPCTNAETAGDWGTYHDPSSSFKFGKSRIYNVSGSLTTIRFVGDGALADCNRLYVGEGISAQYTPSSDRPVYGMTVSAKNCGASPPEITISETGLDYTHNGTTGVPFFTGQGIGSNHYGIVVRKKSTTSGSTLSIDYVLWRAAWSAAIRLNWASGGFGKKCGQVADANGYFPCVTELDGGIIVGIKPNATGDGLDMVNYGAPVFRGDLLPGIGSALLNEYKNCLADAGNSMTWDDTTAGRFYCGFKSTYPNPAKAGAVDNRNVLVMMDMAFTVRSGGNPDGYGAGTNGSAATALAANTLLTPCYSGCTVSTDDYTPYAQLRRFEPTFNSDIWGNCDSTGGVQGDVLFGGCRPGQQNYPSYGWAMDLGNRQPAGGGYVGSHGADQIFTKFESAKNVATPWCGAHTGQSPDSAGGSQFSINEVNQAATFGAQGTALSSCNSAQNPGTCSACPNVTVSGYSYTSSNLWCSTITMSSSWPGGGAPGYFTAGDPVVVSAPDVSYKWLKPWEVGDTMYNSENGGELVKILEKSGTTLTILRGWGGWYDAARNAKAHSDGATWTGVCNAAGDDPTTVNPSAETASPVWYFSQDTSATNPIYTFKTHIHNHAFHFGYNNGAVGYGVKPNAPTTYSGLMVLKFPLNDYATYKSLFYGGWAEVGQPTSFGGKAQWPYGNALETHPGAQQSLGNANAVQWFHDIRVRLFSGSTMSVTQEAGKSHIYYMGGSGLYFNPKYMEQEVWSGSWPLQRSDTLTDSGAGRGFYCIPIVTNDCFSGSTAGRAYFSSDVYDSTWGPLGGCRDTIFQPVNGDICFGNTVGVSAATVQTKFPPANGTYWPNGAFMRVVSKEGRRYRESATENVHSDPTGVALLHRDFRYTMVPSFPPVDGVNRATWQQIKVPVVAVLPGTSTVTVEFGYTPTFQCSLLRDNGCIAEAATISSTDPYKFDHETISGLSCASGCEPVIPVISNRVLYSRVVFRNSGGSVIGRGPTRVRAIN